MHWRPLVWWYGCARVTSPIVLDDHKRCEGHFRGSFEGPVVRNVRESFRFGFKGPSCWILEVKWGTAVTIHCSTTERVTAKHQNEKRFNHVYLTERSHYRVLILLSLNGANVE